MISRFFIIMLAVFCFVDGNNSIQNNTTQQESHNEISSNSTSKPFNTNMRSLDNLFTQDMLSNLFQTKEVQDTLRIIKDESSHVSLPANGFNDTREVVFAFLRLDLWSVLRRILAQRPASAWFPAPPNLNHVCYNHLMAFLEGLTGRSSNVTEANETRDKARQVNEEWALRMFDSYGKPNSGLFVGRLQLIGDYDQCISTEARVLPGISNRLNEKTSYQAIFNGRYCRVRMPMSQNFDRRLPENVNTFWLDEDYLPININWGICVPDTCNGDDIKTFLTKGTLNVFNLPIEEVICFEEKNISDDPGAVFVIFLLALFAFLVLMCTVIHFYTMLREEKNLSGLRRWWSGETAFSRERKAESGDEKSTAGSKNVIINGSSPDLLQKTPVTVVPECSTESGISNASAGDCSQVKSSQSATEQSNNMLVNEIDATNSGEQAIKVEGISNKGFEMYDLDLGESETTKEIKPDELNTANNCHNKEENCKNQDQIKVDIETKHKDEKPAPQSDKSNVPERINSLGSHIIKGASLYTNFLQLMNTDTSSSKPTIKCLEGLKAISMAWVVLGHTYTFGGIIDETNIIYDNALEMTNIPHRLAFHIVGSAQFGVDTFFVICGCLVMFISLDKLRFARQKGRFWACFVFHRFWRLTPIYMVVLAIGTTLYDHVVHGPLKANNLEEVYECREKWWAHLLYINNFYRPTQKCMTWTWYLAVDMQLHVLSPLFIYPVYRNRRVGLALIGCLLLLGLVSAFISEMMYGGQFLLMDMNFENYWSYVYTMPWTRVGAFAIGLLLGVVLRDLDKEPQAWELFLQRKWSRRLFTPGMWILNAGVGICLLLLTHVQWKHGSGHWGRPALAVFESLSRPLWSLAVAWVIFACNTGRAGPVANILSWAPFVTLSRLAYSMYLLHPLIILCVIYSRRTAIYLHPDRVDQVYNYLGNLVLTHLFAVVLYLLVETPLRSLEILWQPRRAQRKTVKPTS